MIKDINYIEVNVGNKKIAYYYNPQKSVTENSESFWGLIDNTLGVLSIYEEADIIEMWDEYCRLRMKW